MLSFRVDPESDVPVWAQLARRIAYLIESGELKAGDQLPTVRGLASEISVNYNTVNKAYLSLASDGYIESVRGRGAFVRSLADEVGAERAGEVDGVVEDCIRACLDMGLSYDDVLACVARKVRRMKHEAGGAGARPAQAGRVIRMDMGNAGGDAPSARTGA